MQANIYCYGTEQYLEISLRDGMKDTLLMGKTLSKLLRDL